MIVTVFTMHLCKLRSTVKAHLDRSHQLSSNVKASWVQECQGVQRYSSNQVCKWQGYYKSVLGSVTFVQLRVTIIFIIMDYKKRKRKKKDQGKIPEVTITDNLRQGPQFTSNVNKANMPQNGRSGWLWRHSVVVDIQGKCC